MRSIFAFPTVPRTEIESRLDAIGQRSTADDLGYVEWIIDDAMWVRVLTDGEGLYKDWEPGSIDAVSSALGGRPPWAVVADVSGRIPGHIEVQRLLQVLIGSGGHALDDYSDDLWAYAQIDADARTTEGRRFFHPDSR